MIRIEINEGKELKSAKKWQRELPWHGSGRIVIGDSQFAFSKNSLDAG